MTRIDDINFQFLFPQKIIFKSGCVRELGKFVKKDFPRPLLITGGGSLKAGPHYEYIISSLKNEKIDFIEFSGIDSEPTPEIVDRAAGFAAANGAQSIISIGGGSVIDTGKAVAALVTNEKGVENYLEGVGKGYRVVNNPLPFAAVPTTAGSGAEVTKNAVITSYEKKYKKSFRDDTLVAKLVIADPCLTMTLPKNETAFGGMDAVCQLIESFVTKNNNIFARALSAYFIPRAMGSLSTAYEKPDDLNARSIMMASSIASGLALANSGLGAVHGFASGIGGAFSIPHGLICAVLLPGICRMNADKNPEIYKELSSIINGDGSEDESRMIGRLSELNVKMNVPEDFRSYNLHNADPAELVRLSKGSSMNGNPVDLTDDELAAFIKDYF